MVIDDKTNKVYFAEGLSKHYMLAERLVYNLYAEGIDFAWLPGTEKDMHIWARDYMPIQLEKNLFLQYQYNPDYLQGYRNYIPDYQSICKDLGLNCITTDIVLDGGNVVPCGNKVIMTDKIFKENPGYGREELVDALENLFFADLVLIPWDRYEIFGHADGMVRYIDGNRVLLNNYGNIDPYLRKRLLKALSPHFEVEELHYSAPRPSKQSWAFLNYLQVKDCIFVPNLPIPESRQAQEQLMRIFPNKKVIMIDGCKDLVLEGGALHCVSWNVMGDEDEKPLEDANTQ